VCLFHLLELALINQLSCQVSKDTAFPAPFHTDLTLLDISPLPVHTCLDRPTPKPGWQHCLKPWQRQALWRANSAFPWKEFLAPEQFICDHKVSMFQDTRASESPGRWGKTVEFKGRITEPHVHASTIPIASLDFLLNPSKSGRKRCCFPTLFYRGPTNAPGRFKPRDI